MGIIKKPYEISLWEDVLTFVYKDGFESTEKIVSDHGEVIAQYYDERKICIIGSNTMDTPIRAVQPKLVSKINGENVLTFNMYSHYYDNETEQFIENPFIGLLINERKIKLRYGEAVTDETLDPNKTKWYDLVIKNIQENSDTKTYTYTAKDLFVNELSKSGFNLEFDTELENNMGNIGELGEEVLKESDWKLDSVDILKQTVDEPLYAITLKTNIINATNMEDENDTIDIESGKVIYAFYNDIVNKNEFLQFLYVEGNKPEYEKYSVDTDGIITNSKNWFTNVTYVEDQEKPIIAENMSISTEYRGKRLVRKARTEYDAVIDKYVTVYNDGQVYGFTETKYDSPASVRSFVTNPNNFDSEIGWDIQGEEDGHAELSLVSVPDVRDLNPEDITGSNVIQISSCLKAEFKQPNGILFNSGIVDNRHLINGFVKDEQYVFMVKYGEGNLNISGRAESLKDSDVELTLSVREYTKDSSLNYNWKKTIDENGQEKEVGPIFEGKINSNSITTADGYKYVVVNCQYSLSYAEMIEMSNSLGLFIQPKDQTTLYFEDVQFFPYVNNGTETEPVPLFPNQIANPQINTIYYYYDPKSEYKTIEELQFLYKGPEPSPAFEEAYNEKTYEKIRSITASESNRFNLLQELCEIFECWIDFRIDHDPKTGKILLGKDVGIDSEEEKYRQQKWVSFREYIDNWNYSGFRYGVNLKSIQRTIESEAIVSKMIVKDNSNEFATDGFCSVARASENPTGENFLLDFSYYVQQGLLGMAELTNDLYLENASYLGYYKKLKSINKERDQYIKEQSGLLTDIAEYSASLQTYNISAAEASKQRKEKEVYVRSLTGYTYEELISNSTPDKDPKIYEWWSNEQLLTTMASIGRLKSIGINHTALADKTAENLQKAQKRYDELNRILTSRKEHSTERRLLLEKERLHRKFYKKYSRFLQEGSWISEDYIDDNLYYLDAQSTLHTSSQPKITYNISVLELSQLEGYENFEFALGDKTTMIDTEFFGWYYDQITGLKTPYKEEIIVTEMTAMLDSPEQNQIKVQNFKTQFEDLFQRMAATTQSVEYSTGKYQKVSGIIESNGTINITTLQNSIANNALTLQNSKDQSVVWDETGITTTSSTNPAEIVRIVSGGVFLSVDGGITWNTGITGRGINASYITSGQMNVEEVNILNGSFPSFRWDKTGISAYEFTINEHTGVAQNFNFSKFVRLDQYGLYGINGYTDFNASIEDSKTGKVGEDKIWDKANFALTWSGFQLRTKKLGYDGYIRITEENDIQLINKVVLNGKTEEIDQVKIGLLEKKNGEAIYGLRLKDCTNQVVLEQSSQGKVWIRDELKIGTADTSTVSLGYLKKYRDDDTAIKNENGIIIGGISQVIHAGDVGSKQEFVVYEDGRLEATGGYFKGEIYAESGYFKGEIHADSGTIGGVSIQSILGAEYEVAIEVTKGTVFKDEEEVKILTARLYENRNEIPKEQIKSYNWYKDGQSLKKYTQQIEVSASDFKNNADYSCEIEYGSDE